MSDNRIRNYVKTKLVNTNNDTSSYNTTLESELQYKEMVDISNSISSIFKDMHPDVYNDEIKFNNNSGDIFCIIKKSDRDTYTFDVCNFTSRVTKPFCGKDIIRLTDTFMDELLIILNEIGVTSKHGKMFNFELNDYIKLLLR